jgi:four helix bundle protein
MESIQNTSKSQYYQIPSKSQIPIHTKRIFQDPNADLSNLKNGKVYDIRKRTFLFGQRILEIAEALPMNNINDVLQDQLVKSGTSIGANMEEADGTLTKRDFVNKVVIARKEARETKYWLRLISGKYIEEVKIRDDIIEAQEIINVLSAIITKTREGKSKSNKA